MGLEMMLMAALSLLAISAIKTTRTLSALERIPAPAPCAVDGALRISRLRLLHGEIDRAEYERIRTVLCGRT